MADLSGRSIDRYQVIERLGEGGMATVYKAYDTRLEREVAIKVIRREAVVPEMIAPMLKRFEREARALARLTHPHIVRVYDYGEYEQSPYLVMEYVSGGTLKQLLADRRRGAASTLVPMPYQEACRLLLPVAQALAYAHEYKIIHRDVKPANILLTTRGVPMLSDFGIARILESEGSTQLTGSQVGIGTPEYMAPEQWYGKVTPQTDVYALGIVLYEMITGRRPYSADTPAAIAIKQATEPLPRPCDFAPGLPESVERVIYKALAREPENRYQDMALFASTLEKLSIEPEVAPARQAQPAVTPVQAAVPPLVKAGTAQSQSPRWLWLLGGSGLGILAVAAVFILILLGRNASPTFITNPVKTSQQPTIINPIELPQQPASAAPDGVGTALCLDGQNSYMEIPFSESLVLSKVLTLEAWIKPDRLQNLGGQVVWSMTDVSPVISQSNPGSSAGNFTLAVTPQYILFAFEPRDSVLRGLYNTKQEWMHIAVTHTFGSGSASLIYVNGNSLEERQWTTDNGDTIDGNGPAYPNTRANYYVGLVTNQHLMFSGKVDELRIWNYIRSEGDIRDNMRRRLNGNEAGLNAYWAFDGSTGVTVKDLSQYGNHATLKGKAALCNGGAPLE